MLCISSVRSPSPASSAGLRKTDILISCNGEPLDDWLDFIRNAHGLFLQVEYSRGMQRRSITMRRNPGQDWGMVFEGQSPRTCRKKCIFCFVDQLPEGVRPSLLIKDDDVRYSFFQGTYVTLDRDDVDYAVRMRLSPIHVSVHSTDPSLRGELLGTGRLEPIIEKLGKLSAAGIEVETQIVVVPGKNDGEELSRTLEELLKVPGVKSVGVVPVGITDHRNGLVEIRRPTREESICAVDCCSRWRRRAERAGRGGWVYPSDEFFLLAGKEIPHISYYGDLSLLENGIGMLASLLELSTLHPPGRGTVCTGTLAAPFLERVLNGSDYNVLPVDNVFLGNEVGVAGLLAGSDIVSALEKTSISYNRVVLPSVMFNHDRLALDDLSPEDIARLTGREIIVVEDLRELT